MKSIIMAAGKGTRLATDGVMLPKVMREADGRPLISYVLDSIKFIDKKDVVIVVGYMKDKVTEAFPDYKCVPQGDAAYGTGYAVMCAVNDPSFDDYRGDVIILNGDMPLVREETVRAMYDRHVATAASCTLLSCVVDDELPYGRVVRDESGKITAIVEDADCTPEQKKIKELNVGLYIFRADKLKNALSRIKNDNAKGEYYLTDVPALMIADGETVTGYITPHIDEMRGVNTHEDLEIIGDILRSRL